ncbi:MAG TPA: YdeI/OmpD-associated family protein [Ohtaekwangia sp.]|nr:YdeI/OmpD-associated family protein [Ohtaekwangia sp.]
MFKKKSGSKKYFLSLSKSRRKLLLFRLMNAKQQETRAKRIREIVMVHSSSVQGSKFVV